jgi:nicotinate-nucleotide adenylyltransferase
LRREKKSAVVILSGSGDKVKIGILGGTFDPVHIGHLAVANEARARLGLFQVVFVPAGQPWLKAAVAISDAGHRLGMVRLAIAGMPYLRSSTMELDREGPTYTIDTIRDLKKERGGNVELFFIIGWDNLLDLPRWHRPQELVSLCRLVAVPRVGIPVPDLDELEKEVPGLSSKVVMLDKPEIDISASVIRERAGCGLPIDHLVPPAVASYIKRNGLYK